VQRVSIFDYTIARGELFDYNTIARGELFGYNTIARGELFGYNTMLGASYLTTIQC
jgi:hypothetical protein